MYVCLPKPIVRQPTAKFEKGPQRQRQMGLEEPEQMGPWRQRQMGLKEPEQMSLERQSRVRAAGLEEPEQMPAELWTLLGLNLEEFYTPLILSCVQPRAEDTGGRRLARQKISAFLASPAIAFSSDDCRTGTTRRLRLNDFIPPIPRC